MEWKLIIRLAAAFDDPKLENTLLSIKEEDYMDNLPDNFPIDCCHQEVSLVREDNELGLRSWGWENNRKIILHQADSMEEWKELISLAQTIRDALNNSR